MFDNPSFSNRSLTTSRELSPTFIIPADDVNMNVSNRSLPKSGDLSPTYLSPADHMEVNTSYTPTYFSFEDNQRRNVSEGQPSYADLIDTMEPDSTYQSVDTLNPAYESVLVGTSPASAACSDHAQTPGSAVDAYEKSSVYEPIQTRSSSP